MLTRREFLKSAAAAGAAAGLAGCGLTGRTVPPSGPGDSLPRRVLGRTGQSVTILGLGCAWISQDGATEAQSRATVEAALAGGVRYFDTAANYHKSEERLGPILAPIRDQVFLVTKTGHADGKRCEKDLANSLRRLKTDHVDLLLQHCVGVGGEHSDTKTMLSKGGSLEFFRKAKARGQVRFIGISAHPDHAHTLTLLKAADDYDVLMPYINYVSRAELNAEEQLLPTARRKGMGVVAMKVIGGDGQLADDYDRAFRYSLSVPGVACALIGVRNADQVRRAVQAANEFRPLTAAEMDETIRLGKELSRAKSAKASLLRKHVERDFGNVRHA